MMKSKNPFRNIILVLITLLTCCTTYHLSADNLFSQLDSSSTQSKGFISPNSVKGNTLTSITCYDKGGNEHIIPVTSHTAVRISKTDNKQVQLYFDTIILRDSAITGSKSHYFSAPINPIKFLDILKIEIQK